MKKYKVTSKHPVYREGLMYEEKEKGDYALVIDQKEPSTIWETIGNAMLEGHMSEGWIEEVQEKEFTKDDMIEFAEQCVEQAYVHNVHIAYEFEKYNLS